MKKNKHFIVTFFILILFLPLMSSAASLKDCARDSSGKATGVCYEQSKGCPSPLVQSADSACDSGEICCSSGGAPVDLPSTYPTTLNNPTITPASPSSSSGGLVPCGKSGGSPCTLCHLIVGIQGLVNWGKNILVIVAIVGIAIAGLIYMISSGSESMITTAKNCFKASVMGFAITLAAWLVINTILMVILVPSGNDIGKVVGKWNDFSCDTSSSALTNSSGNSNATPGSNQNAAKLAECNQWCNDNKATGGSADAQKYNSDCLTGCNQQFGPNGVLNPSGNSISQSQAQQALDSCGVKYVSANTLNNLQDTTVKTACDFKAASGCTPNITSGTTGTSHKTTGSCNHYSGCKLDFGLDICVSNYIEDPRNNYVRIPNYRNDGAIMYQAPNGGPCWAKEGNHWDMSLSACPSGSGGKII